MARILLVRHGQSEWNASGRWQGQADPPLSELGERQAIHAAKALGMVDAIYASDLQRAHHTAELLAAELGADVVVAPNLRERCAGEWEGHTKAEIEERWPGYLERGQRPEGFESDESVRDRVLMALDAIAAAHDGDVLVVSHGGILNFVVRHFDGDHNGLLPNLGGFWLEHDGERFRVGESVVLLDEAEVTRPQQI